MRKARIQPKNVEHTPQTVPKSGMITEAIGKRPVLRNQSMDAFKLLAASLVVFLHFPFPGYFGKLVSCIARIAVPTFFAITGYFNYRANCRQLLRRAFFLFKIEWITTAIYAVYRFAQTYFCNAGMRQMLYSHFSPQTLMNWFFFNVNPFSSHLWYLSAAVTCYLILWVYTKFSDEDKPVNYHPLYIVSTCLLMIHIMMSNYVGSLSSRLPTAVYRNALFFGLPMFSMGLFINEYSAKIIKAFSLTNTRLVLITLICAALGVLEWMGGSNTEMPITTVLEAMALMLLFIQNPIIRRAEEKPFLPLIVRHAASISTYIYLGHILINYLYNLFLRDGFEALIGSIHSWIYPFINLALSLLVAVILESIFCSMKRRRRKS